MYCVCVHAGEYIIRYGEIGREMFIINRGVVAVCSQDGKTVFNILSDGRCV